MPSKLHRVNFGKAIKSARLEKGLTQANVAEYVGRNDSAISFWENGKHGIEYSRIAKLQEILAGNLSIYAVQEYIASEFHARIVGKSFDQWIRDGYELDWLLKETGRLISYYPSAKIAPGEDGCNDFGDDDKWDNIIRDNPFLGFAVIDTFSNEMIGYWFAVSIKKEIFDRGVDGDNINLEITSDDLVDFIEDNTTHYIYIVDQFVEPSYEGRPAVVRPLRAGFLNFIDEIKSGGYSNIGGVLTHASEPRAENLCRGRFAVERDHKHHRRRDACTGTLIPTKIFYQKGEIKI